MSGSTSLEASPASPVDIGIRLEKIRCNHEEIERLEQLVMEDLKTEETSPMKQLLQGHRLRNLAKSIILKSEKLVETYEKFEGDKAPLRFHSPSWETTVVSSAFSSRLKEILEYYETHTSAPVVDYEAPSKEEPVIAFTGEECFGRYLDLHEMYNQYINSSFGERVDYSTYLDVFSQPEKIPTKLKLSRQYTEYMEALLGYLIDFFQRTQPLQDQNKILSKVEADLEEQYGDGKVEGLEKHGQENELIPSHHAVTDIVYYTTVEELIDLEPEKLTEALAALGLNTGGTQQQRAERLFLTKHAPLERKQLLMEAKVKKLCSLLDETIVRTKQNRGKNQALAFEELEGEEGHTESESGDDCNNPLKRRMGWDGKPIPYWLDKLGLGQEYKCEICREYSYAGKRAFERHFKEERHQRRLRCLGLPVPENLNVVTSIEEAREIMLMGMMSKRRRLHRPLEADGKFKAPLARSQLTDQGTEGNGPNQAPVAIPPRGIRSVVEKTVGILSKKGLETERRIIELYGNVEGFEFLKSRDPYHAFYNHTLTEHRACATDGAAAAKRSRHDGGSEMLLPAEFQAAPPPPKPHMFTRRLPEGITGKELDIIKLTAQFWAGNGGCFWEGARELWNRDPQFEFMKPTGGGSRSTLFCRLGKAYWKAANRPEILKERLRENAADMETVLGNCLYRLQWVRFMEEHWEKARKEKAREAKSAPLPLGHLCVMASIAASGV